MMRYQRESSELLSEAYRLMWNGVPSWHRIIHELQSESEARWDRYESLKNHIWWLYCEDARRLAYLGMSR